VQTDAAKIGEGASFTVTKRHDFVRGGKSSLIVMKDSKLKFDRAGKPSDLSVFASILTEIEILSHKPLFEHKNIVKLLDVRWDHPSMYKEPLGPTLYLEYANMGTLSSYFRWYPAECADATLVSRLLLDICRGLRALHACRITHGDLKPTNVLVFKDTVGTLAAKISDFGCSLIQRDDSDEMVELTGFSPPWDAPEAGTKIRASLLHKTDIYSYGLLYWWARLGGRFPFGLGDSPEAMTTDDSSVQVVKDLQMKKVKDLGPMMHESLLTSADQLADSDTSLDEFEVTLIASATLSVNPEDRDLDIVSQALLQWVICLLLATPISQYYATDADSGNKIYGAKVARLRVGIA
jgi:serine/threonine protein kinase